MVCAIAVEVLALLGLLVVVRGVVAGEEVGAMTLGPMAVLVLLLQEDFLVPMIGLAQCKTIYLIMYSVSHRISFFVLF